MWFKIFKYISITKRLTRISKALFKALPDVSAFFFVFVILFIGFGLSAHLLFGNDIEKFSSIGETFLTLFRMMLGDWDYDAIVMSAPVMGPVRIMFSIFASCLSLHLLQVLFVLWICTSAIILLNFIVGVLGEAYNKVSWCTKLKYTRVCCHSPEYRFAIENNQLHDFLFVLIINVISTTDC
jgi:hypothetical protein